jgi:hypothetical protein
MIKYLLAFVLMVAAVPALADCSGGRCTRPGLLIPTLANRPAPQLPDRGPVVRRGPERSIVTRRHTTVHRRVVRRNPGFWARITFFPGR